MRLGDIANPGALNRGKPLDGIKVLALEQMQALPYCTQLLARLGATVVKVESTTGDMGRGSVPSMADPFGRAVGATFLRNNLNKRSICINLKDPRGATSSWSWPSGSTSWPRTSNRAPWPSWVWPTRTSRP